MRCTTIHVPPFLIVPVIFSLFYYYFIFYRYCSLLFVLCKNVVTLAHTLGRGCAGK